MFNRAIKTLMHLLLLKQHPNSCNITANPIKTTDTNIIGINQAINVKLTILKAYESYDA